MKKLLVFGLLAITGCQSKPILPGEPTKVYVRDTVVIHDTIPMEVFIDHSAIEQNNCDSIRRALFNTNYKLERVKYYLKIAIKNPSQDKYLKGWILRAIK